MKGVNKVITGLMVLEAVLSIALIAVVVLQSGKSAGLSGSIAGGAESIFGGKRKGLDEILAKATIIIAALFGIVTMVLVKLMQ
ncbi:MAG: secG [Sporomusa sp.]|jgi:preprotein translocase subunit SecG|nr:secG [Sporomusa sp.]